MSNKQENQRLLRDVILQDMHGGAPPEYYPDSYPNPNPYSHHHHPRHPSENSNGYEISETEYENPAPEEGEVSRVTLKENWRIGAGAETVATDVFILDESYEMQFQILFWITMIELLMCVIFIFVGILVISDTFDNNNYLFTIIGSVASAVVVLFLHGFAVIRMWSRSSRMSHNHNREVRMPFFFGIVLLALGFFTLGRWISDNCTCCATSDCQPDPANFEELVEFYAAWAVMVFMNVAWLFTIVRALFAHIYPEEKVPTTADPRRTKLPLEFQKQQRQANLARATMQQKGAEILRDTPGAARQR
jgi:fumarate reductase subunit D